MSPEQASLKAKCAGGVPLDMIVIEVPGGGVIAWLPTGEVRTLIPARKPEEKAA